MFWAKPTTCSHQAFPSGKNTALIWTFDINRKLLARWRLVHVFSWVLPHFKYWKKCSYWCLLHFIHMFRSCPCGQDLGNCPWPRGRVSGTTEKTGTSPATSRPTAFSKVLGWVPSGKLKNNYGRMATYRWIALFKLKWWFSAMLNYQEVPW